MRRKSHAESAKCAVTFAGSEVMNTFGSQERAGLLLRPPSQIAGEPVECVWELRLRPDDFPFLLDHGVRGVAILPGAMHIELALTFFHAVRPSHDGRIFLQDITFLHAIALQASLEVNLTLKLEANDQGEYLFTCEEADTATLCASLKICLQESDTEPLKRGKIPQTALSNGAASAFYAELQENGNEYGPCIQPITRLYREPGSAWADVTTLDVPANRWGFHLHPVLLDGGFQTLAAAFDAQGLPYVLTGIDRIEILGSLSGTDYWIDAEMASQNGPDDRAAVGQFTIYDRAENAVIEASGVTLRYLAPSTPQRPAGLDRNIPIAISATFTAEPIEGSLAFWGEELGTPFDLQFAPYNQVFQQLLDPASVFGQNREGANVILLRFQDWHQGEDGLIPKADQTQLDKILADRARRVLPNQLEVAHLNQYETDYLYKENFVDRAYLRHGIQLNNGDCVFDVGANIGLFTLFVQSEFKNTRVYAFEPSPPVFQQLNANIQLYGSEVHIFDCGISDSPKQAKFTFNEKSSIFSGFGADLNEDEAAVRAVIQSILRETGITNEEELNTAAEEFMTSLKDSRSFTCKFKSLSEVIREQGVEKIDLLKIDAENSELAILNGIEDADWLRIRQLVLDMHDRDGAVAKSVGDILESKGFELTLEEKPMLRGSGLFTIYARQREPRINKHAANDEAESPKKIVATTLEFASALRSASAGSSVPFIVISCPPTPVSAGARVDETSEAMEKLLARELADASNVHFVSGDEPLSLYPVEDYFDPHSDRLGHVPYTSEFYCGLGTLVARKLDALRRKPYKIIALDCDNTLWGGVCGEDGPHGLDLGGGWRQLQEFMVAQQERGMLLCLCSKNSEEDVFRVFQERPEMPLCRDHFVEHRINWAPKSQSLASLATSLNLGLDSFIFVDDNAVECAEVRARYPEVLTLQLPSDPAQIPSYLDQVWAFDKAKITTEDKTRTKLYQQNLKRERTRAESLNLRDFLEGLGLDIRISPPNDAQLARVAQLTQRTNQFNIKTIRRSETEIRSLLIDDAMSCLVVEVSDRFGDYGLVGVILFATEFDTLKVDTFLLSCRVLGRGVEHKVIAELGEVAVQCGCATVELPFVSTAKNVPALEFLRALGSASENNDGERKIFSLPADAARAITYDPDNVPFFGSGDEDGPGTLDKPVNGERDTAPIDYHRIAEVYPTPESILRAVQANRVRDGAFAGESFAEPANERERSIARVWEQVLGIAKVGAEQSFEELGGDSLKSVLLVVQLQKALSVDLSITDIFEYTTVRAMAKTLDATHDTSTVSSKYLAGQQRESRTGQQATVRAATGDDIVRIVALLIEGFPDMPPDQWQEIFDYKWYPNKPNLGLVLVDGAEIVGFVGTIYSVREINGRPERFCNGTSLYVRPAYRSYSMQLILSFVSQPGHTITALTPNSTSIAIFKEMGFEVLDRFTVIIPPLLQAHSLLRSVGVSVLTKIEEIKPYLTERDLKILVDHEPYPCGHYLAVSKEGTSYIVTRQGRVKRGIKVSEILYCSNRAMLRRHFEIIKLRILLTERALLLMGDERIFGRHCPAGLKRGGHRLFRSETLKATEIDNLYTEFVLLPV